MDDVDDIGGDEAGEPVADGDRGAALHRRVQGILGTGVGQPSKIGPPGPAPRSHCPALRSPRPTAAAETQGMFMSVRPLHLGSSNEGPRDGDSLLLSA